MRIAIIGGTGKEGRGLAMRWARAGHEIAIGSRSPKRGQEGARALVEALGGDGGGAPLITGGDNLWAAGQGEIALLAVPYGAHRDTLAEIKPALAGKILIDITVPLAPPNVTRVSLPEGRAAALEAEELLGGGEGDNVRLVAALHHISSGHLADVDHEVDSDVLVCGDDKDARSVVIGLINDLGMRGLDAGPLANAVALESLTPVLLHMNRRYKGKGCGLRITGIPKSDMTAT